MSRKQRVSSEEYGFGYGFLISRMFLGLGLIVGFACLTLMDELKSLASLTAPPGRSS